MFNFRPHTLEIKITEGGGYDENGNPVPVVESWSDPIPCHVRELERQRIFIYQDGSQGVYNYDVWIDSGIVTEDIASKYVRLKDVNTGRIIVDDKMIEQCIPKQLRTKFYL